MTMAGFTSFCQNYQPEVADNPCDSIYYTSTEYPVRLKTEVKDLQQFLLQQLTLYPEDKEVVASYVFKFKIDCRGFKVDASIVSFEGPKGLSLRIFNLIKEKCQWSPAIQLENSVNSFYELTIKLNKGNIEVIPQKQKRN